MALSGQKSSSSRASGILLCFLHYHYYYEHNIFFSFNISTGPSGERAEGLLFGSDALFYLLKVFVQQKSRELWESRFFSKDNSLFSNVTKSEPDPQ